MVAVAVVVLVGATTNFQKETKFRELNAVKDDIQVSDLLVQTPSCCYRGK